MTTASGEWRRTSSKNSRIGSGRTKFKCMSVSQAMRFMAASIAILDFDCAVVFEADAHFFFLVLEFDLVPAHVHAAQCIGGERELYVYRLLRNRMHHGDFMRSGKRFE